LNIGTRISARPNCVAQPNQSSFSDNVRSNGLVYFNTAAFALPALFTPGNCGRNVLRSPGINNWDTSFAKNTRLTERFTLQTRFEFFNVWNHAQWQIWSGRSGGGYSFGQPGFGNATFGKVTSARGPRVIQIAMKLLFFQGLSRILGPQFVLFSTRGWGGVALAAAGSFDHSEPRGKPVISLNLRSDLSGAAPIILKLPEPSASGVSYQSGPPSLLTAKFGLNWRQRRPLSGSEEKLQTD